MANYPPTPWVCILPYTLPMQTQGNKVKLSPRQAQIALLVCRGRSNKEISTELFTSVDTVKQQLWQIYQALKINSRLELAIWGLFNPNALHKLQWTDIEMHPLGCECSGLICSAVRKALSPPEGAVESFLTSTEKDAA